MMKFVRAGVSICAAVLLASSARATTLTVSGGGDLQAALNAAKPGDTVLLQAGATFTGTFVLPVKGGWADITVRSSASDSALPAPGQRMTPAYASLLPKIRSTSNGPALATAPGATHWRLLFLEFAPAPGTSTSTLLALGTTGSAQSTLAAVPRFLTVDRSYLHGDPANGQRRGIALNSGDTSIINSYFADFKGANQDTQAVCGWNGPGPFLVENNYLEAAGENIMFGGSDPSIPFLVPTGIVIRRNHITRPMAWRSQGWVVKNLLELKNAHDVLVEGNLIENHWVGAQPGSSVVITPRNQSNTAPWSGIKHVVIQNNVIRHVSSGFNILGWDNLAPSEQTDDILIRNNLLYDVSAVYAAGSVAGPGRFLLIGAGPKHVRLDHNTVDSNGPSTVYFYAGATSNGITTIDGFELTNNLLRTNRYCFYGDAVGEGVKALTRFAPNGIVIRNTLAGAAAKLYPTGNDFPTTAQWLADFANPGQGDYRLTANALSRRSGTDGKDLGVDFVELDAAMNGSGAPVPVPTPVPVPVPVPVPTPTPRPASQPYSGQPIALPGRIDVEQYDLGGEATAYHDTTAGNAGRTLRPEGVDVLSAADSDGGYALGWTAAGEWLNYTVNVTRAGVYTIDVRVASSGAGGRFHIEMDGVGVTGPITVPDTGGWHTWSTITGSRVAFAAGRHVLRLVMDSTGPSGSIGNINWLAVR